MSNPVEFAEGLLRQHEISNLESLKNALALVKTELITKRNAAAEEVKDIQTELKSRGGASIAAKLKERQQSGQVGLNEASEILNNLKENFDSIAKSLEKADTHKKNAKLISDLVMKLISMNKGESNVNLPPEHIIYLRHALESKELNQYAKAQHIVNDQYESKQRELIESFQQHCLRKETEKMRKTFRMLRSFEGENEGLNFYVKKVADSLELKHRSGLTSGQFGNLLELACTSIESLYCKEIIENYPKLVTVFGEADTVSNLLLVELFEFRLKPFLNKMLDSDTISQQRFLEYLKHTNDKVTALVKKINALSLSMGRSVDSLTENLFDKLLGSSINNYFEKESKYIVESLNSVVAYVLEALTKETKAIIDVRNLLSSDEKLKGKLTGIRESVNRAECSDIISTITESVSRCMAMNSSNPVAYAGELIAVSLQKLYEEMFSVMLSHMSDALAVDTKIIDKVLETVGNLGRVIKQFDVVFADKIIAGFPPSAKEKYEGHRKRLSINLEQVLIELFHKISRQVLGRVEKTLTGEQKKNDYYKSDRLEDNTVACNLVVEMVVPLVDKIKMYVWSSHFNKILSQFGNRFLKILVNHFSNFVVSQDKAILLTNDMNKYRTVVVSCQNDQLLLDFEKYRQMMNLFILPPDALSSFIHEEPIASIDYSILATYISHREDFKQAKIARQLPSLF